MKSARLGVFALLAIALLVCALAFSVYAAAKPPAVVISITPKGITLSPKVVAAGDHTVIIKNMTSSSRGLEMTGMDKGGSPYVRYSKVLRPSKSEEFRWYFPSGKTVYMRDMTSCVHKSRTCVVATFGGMMAAVTPM